MRWHWLIPMVLFNATHAMGEELEHLVSDPNLTLGVVIEKTFERNPKQRVLQADTAIVDAKAIQAASPLPGAPALSMRHQNDFIGSGRKLREWEAALEMPVWLPGQRSARDAVANDAKANQAAGRVSLMFDLAGQVREAVWDTAMTTEEALLAEQRFRAARGLQQDVERRWKAGELARTDVMLAQNDTLQAETLWLRAQAEVKHAEHRYWMLTGLNGLPANPEESLSKLDRIADTHPLLVEAEARIALARGERNLTQVEKRENPQVIVNARHERGAFDNAFDSSIGLAVRIPFGAEVRSAPLLANSEMNLAKAQSERDQLLLNLDAAMHEAAHNLEVIRDELKIVGEQHRIAQENLQLAQKAFRLGESDLVNLMRVQALAQEAERSLRQRQIQLKWDIARYNQAVGVMP